MKPIDLGLDPQCVVKGMLFDTMEPAYLIDDLLEVDLPSGDTVSVDWDAQSGPHGRFVIIVFRDYWENRQPAQYANSPQEAVLRLRQLAWLSVQSSRPHDDFIPPNSSSDAGATHWTPPQGECSRFEVMSATERCQALTNA